MAQLPPQIQKEMADFQELGERLQIINNEKLKLETSIKEKEEAIRQLSEMEDEVVVYKQVGGLLIKKDKNKVLEELKDEKTTLEMRKKTIERTETSLKTKFEEMQNNLKQKLSTMNK